MTPNLELAAQDGEPIEERRDAAMRIRGLTVSYGAKPAIFSIDADFPRAQMSAIIGPNGAGKSTLLKASLGLLPKVSGEVAFFDLPLGEARKLIAYIPQRASVDWEFPVRVIDVVLMGLYREVGLLGRIRGHHRGRALDCLERVGMHDFAARQIGQLSGGQQQRVFLARALAQNAELFLLDEPFAGVDAATEKAIIGVLHDLRDAGKTLIAVHHDLSTVPDYFDHVFMLSVRKFAEGPVNEAFTDDALRATYGGRIGAGQLDGVAQQR